MRNSGTTYPSADFGLNHQRTTNRKGLIGYLLHIVYLTQGEFGLILAFMVNRSWTSAYLAQIYWAFCVFSRGLVSPRLPGAEPMPLHQTFGPLPRPSSNPSLVLES
jgi:hypothetical protein